MESKIKFLDDFSIDRKLYWRVSDVYGRFDWEITYARENSESSWKLRRSGGDLWFPVDPKNILCELSIRQIDVADFDKQLSSNIMTQAVFSSNLFEEAKKLLGADTINEAINQHNQFAEELLKMIKDLTSTSAENHSTDEPNFLIKKMDIEVPKSPDGAANNDKKIKSDSLKLQDDFALGTKTSILDTDGLEGGFEKSLNLSFPNSSVESPNLQGPSHFLEKESSNKPRHVSKLKIPVTGSKSKNGIEKPVKLSNPKLRLIVNKDY